MGIEAVYEIEAARALIADLVAERDALREALANIVGNAVIGPDVAMKGATDCYHVPIDDIESASTALGTRR